MPSAIVQPEHFPRRSFVTRPLLAHGAVFAEMAGAAVAVGFGGGIEAERAAAGVLGLCDLSPLPRVGFKGDGTVPWLKRRRLRGLHADNKSWRQKDGALAARLAPREVLVLGDLYGNGDLCARLEKAWSREPAPRWHPVPRRDSHFWFVVSGIRASAMLAKLCAVDLRAEHCADGAVAQTMVARLGTVAIRADLGTVPAFHLLGDSAAAEYFWASLIDAMAEFDGRPVGLTALQELGRKSRKV